MPDETKLTRATFGELGAAGLNRYGGTVDNDFIKDLERATSRFKIFTEMRLNDPVIGAILFLVEQMLRRVVWMVEPSDPTDDVAVERAEFIESCMADMSHTWNDFISEAITFLPYGWSWFEQVFKKRLGPKPKNYCKDPAPSLHNDGLVGWRKFAVRAQESLDRWDFDENGGIQGMYQRPAPDYVERYIPIDKSLLFRTRVELNSPEGRSVLRHAYRSYHFKKNLEVIMGIGAERDLAGMPVIYLPPGATKDDYDQARKVVERVRVDEYYGLTIPGPKATNMEAAREGGWLFELVVSGGRHSFALVEMLEYYDRRMSMAVLAQFIMLGSGSVGSFALSRDHSEIFLKALEGWATMIAETINRHAIPKLMRMNGWDEAQSPQLKPSGLLRADIGELSNLIMAFGQAGLDLRDIEDHIRSQANLPPRTEEAKLVEPIKPMNQRKPEVPEEEEVEKAEPWHLVGRIPTRDEILAGYRITPADRELVAAEFEKVLG